MKIEHIQYKDKEYINVFVDKSTSNGLLRFGHEILWILRKVGKNNDQIIFINYTHSNARIKRAFIL